MSITFTHSQLESKIDKVIKQVPYHQTKQDFLVTAVELYLKQLAAGKTIKL